MIKKPIGLSGSVGARLGGGLGGIAPGSASDPGALFREALAHHRAGRLRDAEGLCRRLLAADSRHADALHMLGVIALQAGHPKPAAEMIGRACDIQPRQPDFRVNLATALMAQGTLGAAESHLRHALAIHSGHPEALFRLGAVLLRKGDAEAAVAPLEKAARLLPRRAEVFVHLGIAAVRRDDLDGAISFFRKAVRLAPRDAQARLNLAQAQLQAGRIEEALESFDEAVRLAPNQPQPLVGRGDALMHLGRARPAIEAYRQALAIEPGLAPVHSNLGFQLMTLGDLDGAETHLRRAVELAPRERAFRLNLAQILGRVGKTEEALAFCRELRAEAPDFAPAYRREFNLLLDGGDFKAAGDFIAEIAARALEGCPPEEAAHALLHAAENACAWDIVAIWQPRVAADTDRALAEDRRPAEEPFNLFARCLDPARCLAVSRGRSTAIAIAAGPPLETPRDTHGKPREILTIGYLSADFRDHPTSHLMADLFEAHDRERVRVNVYSTGPDDQSAYRRRIEAGCDAFRQLGNLPAHAIARCLRADGVDILVDLCGHTQSNRLDVCALRPAPIQVTYLGYPGSTGADFFDYIIADATVAPREHEAFFREKIVRMPHSYQVNTRYPLADDPGTCADWDLPEDAFVFCSFCQTYKIEPVMFAAWMRLLKAVPGAVLWLWRSNAAAEGNLRRAAEKAGVDPTRLVFAAKAPKDVHLARIGLADLGLDTRIYGGHTTTSDTLWAGVPVISVLGDHFASRVGAGLLRAAGLPELVAESLEGYEALALRLARTPDEIAALRARLAQTRETSPLFDTARFARALEHAYARMAEIHAEGRPPQAIDVADV